MSDRINDELQTQVDAMTRARRGVKHPVAFAFDAQARIFLCTPAVFERVQVLGQHPDRGRFVQWLDTTGWLLGIDSMTWCASKIEYDLSVEACE